MTDLICRKSMTRCHTPGMCSPHGGCQDPAMAQLRAVNFDYQLNADAAAEEIKRLNTEIERIKKFEDWFTRLEVAATAIDESFRDERDLALFSVYWAARIYMVPSEFEETDDEFREKIIRDGASTLMVGGRRLRDAAEKDEMGRPIIPFDWEYRSQREMAKSASDGGAETADKSPKSQANQGVEGGAQ